MNPIGPILFAPLALAGLSSGATLTESSDAVIEYDRPPPTFGGPVRETMYKHGDRVRIDSGSENRGVKFLHQDYTGPGQQVTFSLTRFEDGGLAYLSLPARSEQCWIPEAGGEVIEMFVDGGFAQV